MGDEKAMTETIKVYKIFQDIFYILCVYDFLYKPNQGDWKTCSILNNLPSLSPVADRNSPYGHFNNKKQH